MAGDRSRAVSSSELLARFDRIRRETPSRALIHLPGRGNSLSAADLWSEHVATADALRNSGVGRGGVVLAAMGNRAAIVPLLLACRAIDAALMPLDAGATPIEIQRLAERFGAAAIATPGLDRALAFQVPDVDPRRYDGVAMLKLTSGSTGLPKAALTTDAQLIADATHIIAAMGIRPDDVQIASIPISHSYGLGNLMLPLLLQGTAFVLRDSFVPQQLPADARTFGARVFPGVPFMFEYFVNNPPAEGWPPSLRLLISAGAPLTQTIARAFHERYGVKIHSFYGATETGGIAYDDGDEPNDTTGAVGRVMPGVTVTLRTGRIHVASAAVACGYAGGEDRGGFVDGGFLTGDCGVLDPCRRLTLAGRVSSFVNVAGRKVQPDEVESTLREMPGIADVRVVAAPDARRGQQLVACIVEAPQSRLTPLAVRRFCAARLAPYKVPRAVLFLDAIPLTARGKTDRAALDALVRARIGA